MSCRVTPGLLWSSSVSAQTAPWQPATASLSSRGLVREEAVRDPTADDNEDLALKARMPSGVHGLISLLVKGLCQNAANFVRLRHVFSSQSGEVDDLRVLTEEFVMLVGLALRLLGALLLVIVPLSATVFFLLSQPFRPPMPAFMGRLSELVALTLLPLDCFLSPLVRFAARVAGLNREMQSGEEATSSDCEVSNRVKRIILGLLVANVLASVATMVALAAFVIVVRFSGILGH